MKRKILIDGLIAEGFSRETLSILNDRQLERLHQKMLGETTVMVNDPQKIKDVEKNLGPDDKIEVGDENAQQEMSEKSNIGKFHKPVFKAEKEMKETCDKMDEKKCCKKCGKKKCECKKKTQVKESETKKKECSKCNKEKCECKNSKVSSKQPKSKKLNPAPFDSRFKKTKKVEKQRKNKIEEAVLSFVQKNFVSLASKKDIMEMIQSKVSGNAPTTAPTKPDVRPARPDIKPNIKPKPQNPFKPGPGVNPKPKAQGKDLTSLPEFLTFSQIVKKHNMGDTTTAPTKPDVRPAPAKPTTRPDVKPKPRNPFKPGPGVNPKPKAQMQEGKKKK